MEIRLVKEMKRQCEVEIRAIIDIFEKESDCIIYGIEINRIDINSLGQKQVMKSKIISIVFDVRIED